MLSFDRMGGTKCRSFIEPQARQLRANGYGFDVNEAGLPLVIGRSHDPTRSAASQEDAAVSMSPQQPAAANAAPQAPPATADVPVKPVEPEPRRTSAKQPLVRVYLGHLYISPP